MWHLIFLLFPVLGVAYVGWHVWQLLPLAAAWRWAAVGVIVAVVALMFVSLSRTLEHMSLPVATAVYETAYSSLFILLYLAMTFIVLDALRAVRLLPREWIFNNGWTAAAITLAMLLIFVGGNIHYRHKTRQPLSLTTTKKLDKKSLKIVMLSDLHLGYHNRRHELARWVDMLNAEHADIILIGGDIIDISTRPLTDERMWEEMRRLNAPVYACLGNHEYYSGSTEAQRFYREAGITLLRDSVAHVDGITIVGRDDRTNSHRQSLGRLMKGVDHSQYIILLDHQPYHLEQAEKQGVDFQFSGHTHHGQVWPISWITEAMYEKAFGEHQRGKTRYYVSSGMGIWGGKFRIGTRSEYVVATVTTKSK